MASRYRSLFDADVQASLANIPVANQASEPQTDIARAQTLARSSGNPEAQRQGNAMLDDAERQRRKAAYQAGVEAKRAQKEQEAAAKEQAAASEADRKRTVRAGAAAGVQTETDIETGKRTLATNDDGTPKFKTGPVGAPVERPTINENLATAPGLGDVVNSGVLGTPAPYTGIEVAQTYRNEAGDTITRPLPTKTDPKTGVVSAMSRKDEFGAPVKQELGVDPAVAAKAAKDVELEQRRQSLERRDIMITQAKRQFDPKWKPAKEEFDKAGKELNAFNHPDRQPFMRAAIPGTRDAQGWFERDPKTGLPKKAAEAKQVGGKWVQVGDPVPANPEELTKWQADQARLKLRHDAAKKAHDAMLPTAENLNRNMTEIEDHRLNLRIEKIQNDHPELSADTGAITRILANEANPDVTLPENEAVKAVTESPALSTGIPADPAAPATAGAPAPVEKPIIPPDDTGMFAAAFEGLRDPSQFTVGDRGDGYRMIQRAGRNVGSIEDSGGSPVVVLNTGVNEDLRGIAALGGTRGVPVYLANGSRQPLAKEAAWATQAFQAAQPQAMQATGPAGETIGIPGPEVPREVIADNLRAMGADLPTIIAKVRRGEISMQVGESLAKGIYGETLQASDPLSPDTVKAFLTENPDVAGRWQASDKGAAAKNEVTAEFVSDWYAKNQHKPGVTWGLMEAARKQHSARKGFGEQAKDLGGILTDAGGSMVGLLAAYPTIVGMGLATAVTGDEDITDATGEMLIQRGRANKNFLRGLEANRKKWFTGEGKAALGTLGNALADLKATNSTRDGYPDGTASPQWKAEMSAKLDAVTDAAAAMHAMNQEDGWAMTRDDVDANKNRVLKATLGAFLETGDPDSWNQFQRRLLLDKGSLQSEQYSQDLTEGRGRFASAVIGGAVASDFEAVVEILSDVLTVGAAKAITIGGKALKAEGAASKLAGAGRVARFGEKVAKDFHKLGMVTDTLANPAGKLGKASNVGVKLTKAGVVNAATEGVEEAVSAIGDPTATSASVAEQAAIGGLMGLVLAPVMVIPSMAATTSRENYKQNQRVKALVDSFNAAGAKDGDFKPITREQAIAAIQIADNPARKEASDRLEASKLELQAAQADLLATTEADTTAGSESAASRFSRAMGSYAQAANDMSNIMGSAMEITQAAQGLPPAERAQVIGLAKVGFGRPDLLSPAERQSIAGRQTRDGQPFFTGDMLTDAGRAELQADYPVLGRHLATPESIAIFQAQTATKQTNEPYPQGTPGSQATPENPQPAPADAGAPGGPVQPGAGPTSGVDAGGTGANPEASPQVAAGIADRIKAKVEAALPNLAGRINVRPQRTIKRVSGGALANSNGTIDIVVPDIEEQIKQGFTPEDIEASLEASVRTHETVHVVQYQAVRQLWEESDKSKSGAEFFDEWYGKIFSELSPEAIAAARDIYGAKDWDGYGPADSAKANALRAAELVRMLVEAKLDPAKSEEFSELFRAISLKSPITLIETIRRALEMLIEMVNSGQFSKDLQVHIDAITELYNELRNAETAKPAEAGIPATEKPSAPTGQSDAEVGESVPKSVGLGIGRALKKYPILSKNDAIKNALYDLTDPLMDLVAEMEPAARAEFIDQQFGEFAESLAPEATPDTEGKREKAKANRRAYEARIRDKARAILNSGNYSVLSSIFEKGKITPKPNAISLILARSKAGQKLTEREMDILRPHKEGGHWDGMPRKQDYPGGGNNAVIRTILDLIMAAPGQGQMPHEMGDGLMKGVTDASSMWQEVDKAFRALSRGETLVDGDPDAVETPENIAKAEAAQKAAIEAQPQTMDTVARDIAAEFGADSAIAGKARAIADNLDRLTEQMEAVLVDAFKAEAGRVRNGTITAEAWAANTAGWRPELVKAHNGISKNSPQGLRKWVESLPVIEDEAPMFSSAPQDFDFGAPLDASTKAQKGFDFGTMPEGANAKFQENAQKAFAAATTDKARENIAARVAAKEGLKDPAAFVKAAIGGQASFNFGTDASFDTKKQMGFDFTGKPVQSSSNDSGTADSTLGRERGRNPSGDRSDDATGNSEALPGIIPGTQTGGDTARAAPQPSGELLPPQSGATPSVGRFRPKTLVEFKNPITGPSGAKLAAYEWKYRLEEGVDKRGEDSATRVSNWEESATNDNTGREVVHQFHVETPDGKSQVVSLETALELLGYTTKNAPGSVTVKSLASTVKTRAKNQIRLAPLEAELEAVNKWQDAYDTARRNVDTRKMPEMTVDIDAQDQRAWQRGGFSLTRYFPGVMRKPSDYELRQFAEATREGWIDMETKKVVGESPQTTRDLQSDVLDLKRRIKLADAKIEEITKKAQVARPEAPRKPETAEIPAKTAIPDEFQGFEDIVEDGRKNGKRDGKRIGFGMTRQRTQGPGQENSLTRRAWQFGYDQEYQAAFDEGLSDKQTLNKASTPYGERETREKLNAETLTSAYRAILPNWRSEQDTQDEIGFAMPTLKRLGKSDVDQTAAIDAIRLIPEFGTNAPLYFLGLKEIPAFGREWMPDVSTRKAPINKADFLQEMRDFLSKPATVDAPANEAATSPANDTPQPTDAQKKAGNYKVGRVNLSGMDISIENPSGSVRSGTDNGGKRWEVEMKSHYGYLRNSTGRDGDHIDIFIQEGTPLDYTGPVFVVNQNAADGTFDEHKAVTGPDITTEDEAKAEYLRNYAPGWKGAGSIVKFESVDSFRQWATEKKRIGPVSQETASAFKSSDLEAKPSEQSSDLPIPVPSYFAENPSNYSTWDIDAEIERAKQVAVLQQPVSDEPGPRGIAFTPEMLHYETLNAEEAASGMNGQLVSGRSRGASQRELVASWVRANQLRNLMAQSKRENPAMWDAYEARQNAVAALPEGAEVLTPWPSSEFPLGSKGTIVKKFKKNWRIDHGYETLTRPEALRPAAPAPTQVETPESLMSSAPQQPDLFSAANAPDATQRLGTVKVGTMSALGAYRTLTAKRDAGKTLTADEEQKLLDAETALGQKLAFDMDALKGTAPATTEQSSAVPPPVFGQNRRSTQDEMSRAGEIDRAGQMSLLSSSTERLDASGNPQGIDTNNPGGANIGDAAQPGNSIVTPEMDAAYLDAVEGSELSVDQLKNEILKLDDYDEESLAEEIDFVTRSSVKWKPDPTSAKSYDLSKINSEEEAVRLIAKASGIKLYNLAKLSKTKQILGEFLEILKAKGYTREGWHVTGGRGGSFAASGRTVELKVDDGTHFFSNRKAAEKFADESGGKVFEFLLNLKNPKRVEDVGTNWGDQFDEIKGKQDGLVYQNEYEGGGDSFVIQFGDQAVRTDLIIRDKAGNVIPLSERFNQSTPADSGALFSSPPTWPRNLYEYTYRTEGRGGDTRHIVRTYNERTGMKEDRTFDTYPEAKAEMEKLDDLGSPVLMSSAVTGEDYTAKRFRDLLAKYEEGTESEQALVGEMAFIIEDAPDGYFPDDLVETVTAAAEAIRAQYDEWGGRDDLRELEDAVNAIEQYGESQANQPLLSSAVTKGDDARYLAAVEAGDMETAQRMVDEAAKNAGYDSETFYHTATASEPFTEFKYAALTGGDDRYKTNGHKAALTFTLEGLGSGWFTSNSSQFKAWRNADASNVVRAKVKLQRPLTIQADPFIQQAFVSKKKELSDVRDKIKDHQEQVTWVTQDEFKSLREREKQLAKEVDFSQFDEDQILKLSEQLNETYTKKGIKDIERQIKKLSERTGDRNEILKRRSELKYADPFYGLMSMSETASQEYPDLIPGAAVRAALKEQGYDGIILEGTNADTKMGDTTLATWVIPFDGGAAIKSADPVTRDVSGNVIPLSQRFNPASDSILYSSAPSPAIQQALDAMDPRMVAIYQAAEAGRPAADIMREFNVTERGITNAINQVRARVVIATKAEKNTLQPEMKDGKFVNGRPDLAEGADPDFVSIDQIRNDSNIPDVVSMAENYAEAERRLAADYQGEFSRLERMARTGGMPDRVDIALAKTIIRRESQNGAMADPARRIRLALFRVAYRNEMGTEQGRAFQMRRDEAMTPAERNALHLEELLYEPSPEVRERMKNATPETQDAILKKWMEQIDAFKAEMKAEGYDIDASLEAFRARQTEVAAAEKADSETAEIIQGKIRKLTAIEKTVILAIRGGSMATAVHNQTGLPFEEIFRINGSFNDGIRKAIDDTIRNYMESALAASSPADYITRKLAEMGVWSNDMIDDRQPDIADKREEVIHPKKTRERKEKVKKAAPQIPDLTPEQQTALDEAFIRFQNADPATWRTLWQTETRKLTPMVGQKAFAAWKGAVMKPWRDLWQTEMAAITNPAGRMSFDEWISKPANVEKFRRSRDMFALPINETTGTRSPDQDRLLPRQPELINETTGTFDVNDPVAMAHVLSEYATTQGTWIQKSIEWFKMAILSGMQTIQINALGGIHVGYDLGPKRLAEASWNSLLSIFGAGDVRSATLSEFMPMMKNVRAAMRLAATNGIRSWKIEAPVFEKYAEAKPIQLEFDGKASPEFSPPPALHMATLRDIINDPSFKNATGGVNRFMRNITFRQLTATDEFWKGMYAQLDVAAISHRIAAKEEGLSGDAYAKRVDELMKTGSKAWLRNIDRTKKVTFQNENAYGHWTKEDERKNPAHEAGKPMTWKQALEKSKTESIATFLDALAAGVMDARHLPFAGPLLHMFALPFVLTPKNITNRAIEVTPLGTLIEIVDGMRSLRRRLYSGKLTKQEAVDEANQLYDKSRFVQAITNQTIMIMAYLAVESLAGDDDDDKHGRPWITGTMPWQSTKKGERDNAESVMPAQSIRIGDTIIPYKRLEPFSTAITALVDLANSLRRNDGQFNAQVLNDQFTGLQSQFEDKLFLKGLGDILKTLKDPNRGADRLLAGYATAFIPNLIRQPIREFDSKLRDKSPMADDGILTAIGKRIGYELVPQAAPVKLDIWGDEISAKRGDKVGDSDAADALFRIFDPFNARSGAKVRPIDAWIYQYNRKQANSTLRIGIEAPESTVRIQFQGEAKPREVALTSEERNESIRRVGKAALEMLGNEWDWRTAGGPDSLRKAEMIKDVFTKLKRQETARLKQEKYAQITATNQVDKK